MSRNSSENDRPRSSNGSGYATAGAVLAGVAALTGGIYYLAKGRQQEPPQETTQKKKPIVQSASRQAPNQRQASNQARPVTNQARPALQETNEESASVSGYLYNLLSRMATPSNSGVNSSISSKLRGSSPPANPVITNLNSLLSDIHVRYIQIKTDDFQLHYKVFDKIFQHLHQKMKEVDPYYRKYSSTVQFAGSHYDNLRIKKPDEFDMDIVISLPLNLDENPQNVAESDIFIETKAAGFVQLKMGIQFQRLPMRDGTEWQNNKAAFEWMDDSHYLLRSRFTDWFKSVANRALNKFEQSGNVPVFYVDGVPYYIGKSSSGPAFTLIIKNESRGFKLDVDLVPALKFPERRWPVGARYRRLPAGCGRGSWLVVGKPLKNGVASDERRSWRLALHNQERGLMHDSCNLRQAVRLVKKLRDALEMKKIASYYIKTLFFWEIVERNDKAFWQKNNPAFLFKLMVGRLHTALVNRNIPYFWNKNNNLIGNVDDGVLYQYAAKLVPVMQVLENPSQYKQVAKYLLTPQEFKEYNTKFLHI